MVLGLLLSGNAYALELPKINFPEADIKLYEGPKSSAGKQISYLKSLEKAANKASGKDYRTCSNLSLMAHRDFIMQYPKHRKAAKYLYWYIFSLDLETKNCNPLSISTKDLMILNKILFTNYYKQKGGYTKGLYKIYMEQLYVIAKNLKNEFTKNEQAAAKSEFCNEFLINSEEEKIKFKLMLSKLVNSKEKGRMRGINSTKVWFLDYITDENFSSKREILFNSYELLRCSQVQDNLDQVVDVAKNSSKTQTGFKIDLVENNNDLKKIYQKYEIIFDFKNFVVHQLITPNSKTNDKSKVIKRSFDMIKFDNDNILMQETVGDFLSFCESIKINNTNKDVKISNTISLTEECNKVKAGYALFNGSIRKEHCRPKGLFKSKWKCYPRGARNDSPYIYMNFNLKNNEITKEYWPSLRIAARKEYEKLFSKSVVKFEKPLNKTNFEKTIEFLFWAATAYLIIDQIGEIIDIAKSTNHSNKIAPGTSSSSFSSNPANWSNPTTPLGYSRKIKILKHFGRLR